MATDTRNPTSDESLAGTWSGSAGTRYTLVNDYPDAAPASVLSASGAIGANIAFGFAAFAIPAGSTSISIDVLYYDREASSGANAATGRLKVGGNYYNGTEHDPSTLQARDDAWATNPKTTVAWTVDDVNGVGANALEAFGVRSSDVTPGVDYSCVQLKVTYTPSASGPAGLKTVNGLAKASVKTINGLALASVKTWNGLA